MRYIWPACFAMIGSISISVTAQSAPGERPPQSARQALIEMFLGKGADDFTKHLPDDARHALIHKGEMETSIVLRVASIGRDLGAQGEHIESFDEGPNILVSEKAGGREKTEVTVERDSLLGEEDEIELSVHFYKDGQLQSLPVVPRLTFTMKQENEIWRLNEVTVAAHIPLTDPDYLNSLRKEQDEADENAARFRINVIAQDETTYAKNHPEHGYNCALTELFPTPEGQGEAPFGNAPGSASEESGGYRFAISGCNGTPSVNYRVTAVPIDPDSEMKIFCADESGTLKSIANGKNANCFKRGEAVGSTSQSTTSD